MKLPNGERAQIDRRKLIEYSLDPDHHVGGHKARVFAAVLGLTVEHAGILGAALLQAARDEEATLRTTDEFGEHWVVDFTLRGPSGGEVTVRSAWIIRPEEDFPRLVSTYIPKKGRKDGRD